MGECTLSVLVVDDEEIALRQLCRILSKEGLEPVAASSGGEAAELLAGRVFDLVLTDLVMEPVDGLELLALAKEEDAETEVIIVTGHASIDSAIEATRLGAFHYLQKPIRPGEVRSIVRQAAHKRKLIRQLRDLEEQREGPRPVIIGHSPALLEVKKQISQFAQCDANVLIVGDSGTGKELVAQAIHHASERKRHRLLAINCASFTDELLANELFGHEKGAYTGANQTRAGLLESAHKGTVFFDEVGDMPWTMQAKLLRVLQEKELLRVGGTQPVSIDVRVISATNKDLKKMCDLGRFRQDLYYRLSVLVLPVPALVDRREDIPLLASHFLARCARRSNKPLQGFTEEALGRLLRYGFPGNVRELENIVEHACSVSHGPLIEVDDLPADLQRVQSFLFHQEDQQLKSLEEIEWEYIQWVLEQTGNNKSEAARILGIDRASLYRKLKRHQLLE